MFVGVDVMVSLLIIVAEKMKEIESFRSLDAELSGTQGKQASALIEEKDAYGADIAV